MLNGAEEEEGVGWGGRLLLEGNYQAAKVTERESVDTDGGAAVDLQAD